jgi:hypothetical protein
VSIRVHSRLILWIDLSDLRAFVVKF